MKSKMMKITATLAATFFVAIVALPHLVDVDSLRPRLEASLQSSLARPVHIGHMQISLLAGGAHVEDISISDDPTFRSGNFVQAKSLEVGVSLLALLFSRSLHVTSLTLNEPEVTITQSASGKWNFSTIGGSNPQDDFTQEAAITSTPSFRLDRVNIINGTIVLPGSRSTTQAGTVQGINLELRNVSFDSSMSFVVTGRADESRIEIQGQAGPINRTDPEQTPFHAAVKVERADLARITALGSPSALGGLIDLQASLKSDGHTLRSEGKARAERLRLVRGGQAARQPVSLHFITDYSFHGQTGVLRSCEIVTGNGTARLTGNYGTRGNTVTTHLKLTGSRLPLDSIEGVLPALGIQLPAGSTLHGGTVTANLSFDGPVDRMVMSGSAELANARLSGFDLGSKLSTIPGMRWLQSNAELGIESLSSHFRIAPQGIHISNFTSEISEIGGLSGDGDIDASHNLQFHMAAHVAGDGMLRSGLNYVGLKGVPDDIPFLVEGTTSQPIILPDLREVAKTTAKKMLMAELKNLTSDQTDNASKNESTSDKKAKGGFFHKLFGHKDKDKENAKVKKGGVQLATKY